MAAGPSETLQHESPAEERILMMDYVAIRAQFEGALCHTPPPPPRSRWGLAEATMVRAIVSSPPPTIGEVDRLYP
jgi:hypothetical protein